MGHCEVVQGHKTSIRTSTVSILRKNPPRLKRNQNLISSVMKWYRYRILFTQYVSFNQECRKGGGRGCNCLPDSGRLGNPTPTSSTSFPNATLTSCLLFSLTFGWVQQQSHPKVSEKSGQLVRVAFRKEVIFVK